MQGEKEADEDYRSRFVSRLKNMEMAGGAHILCSPQLLGKELENADKKEIEG